MEKINELFKQLSDFLNEKVQLIFGKPFESVLVESFEWFMTTFPDWIKLLLLGIVAIVLLAGLFVFIKKFFKFFFFLIITFALIIFLAT